MPELSHILDILLLGSISVHLFFQLLLIQIVGRLELLKTAVFHTEIKQDVKYNENQDVGGQMIKGKPDIDVLKVVYDASQDEKRVQHALAAGHDFQVPRFLCNGSNVLRRIEAAEEKHQINKTRSKGQAQGQTAHYLASGNDIKTFTSGQREDGQCDPADGHDVENEIPGSENMLKP